MSYTAILNVRNYLISSSAVTSKVGTSSIMAGWPKELDKFPSILLSQSAGTDFGFLGYKEGGLRREDVSIQVDIFSKETRKEVLDIGDAIVPVIISSMSARKTGDVDMYDNELNVYRKMQTYSFLIEHDDF